ncbi:hypothetical protein BOW34_12855 [Solemya velum gill symbiont]|uniref:histone H1/H5 family protein n=3 Tax=Solemya velum gill symbiont TaxID=2340 RepID=UPI0009985F94|nr:histone H1/H5 family protein [Solemya velum gill symbiont]OOZ28994.1 hypothetical protein BOW34_12855 [Solemya velum gill symbiont]
MSTTPKKSAAKPKKPVAHPKYSEMVKTAVTTLKERGGSSRQAILKYIIANYSVGADAKSVNSHLKIALRNGVKSGSLKQSKGTGASGSFRIGEKEKIEKKKPAPKKVTKPKAAAKPKAPKPKSTPKKAAVAKKSVKKDDKKTKKTTKPKATGATKTKTAAKKTPKKAAKPKPKTKTPKKKTAKKECFERLLTCCYYATRPSNQITPFPANIIHLFYFVSHFLKLFNNFQLTSASHYQS